MHRSGTSCLTGSLQQAGLFLGDTHEFSKHNWKGNRENQNFVDLDDLVLEANEGAWDSPPARVRWSEEHLTLAKELLAGYSEAPVFGFNFGDPEEVLDEKIFRVAAEMGLPGRSGDEKFYTSDFINNSENDGPKLPWKINRLYKKLKKVSL